MVLRGVALAPPAKGARPRASPRRLHRRSHFVVFAMACADGVRAAPSEEQLHAPSVPRLEAVVLG